MRHVRSLPIWKRVIIAAQILTLPIWLLPYCLYVGMRECLPEVPSACADAWRLITAPRAAKAAIEGRS